MKSILLHACCGPCSIYPSGFLQENGYQPELYYFNPNIHPYQEFKRRLAALHDFAQVEKLPLIVDKNYDLEVFLRGALAEPELRCYYCYRIRMRKTAEYAKNNGYDSFSSTLLGSPYQRHEDIKKAAEEAAGLYGVKFSYFDFRDGFSICTKVSREREMYRQAYCGCIFSERDRYEKKRKENVQ